MRSAITSVSIQHVHVHIHDTGDMERRNEEDGEGEVLYEDLFPGYPSGLKMRADLAKFVSQRTIFTLQLN